MLGTTLPTPLYPLYEQRYGFGELLVTVIFALYAIGVVAGLIAFGNLSDDIGRKLPLLRGAGALGGERAALPLRRLAGSDLPGPRDLRPLGWALRRYGYRLPRRPLPSRAPPRRKLRLRGRPARRARLRRAALGPARHIREPPAAAAVRGRPRPDRRRDRSGCCSYRRRSSGADCGSGPSGSPCRPRCGASSYARPRRGSPPSRSPDCSPPSDRRSWARCSTGTARRSPALWSFLMFAMALAGQLLVRRMSDLNALTLGCALLLLATTLLGLSVALETLGAADRQRGRDRARAGRGIRRRACGHQRPGAGRPPRRDRVELLRRHVPRSVLARDRARSRDRRRRRCGAAAIAFCVVIGAVVLAVILSQLRR